MKPPASQPDHEQAPQSSGDAAVSRVDGDCPYCHGPMRVTRMCCDACRVQVEADFPMNRLGELPVEHQRFIEMFVLAGGNLKTMAEQTGVSYPTVRSRLDKVIVALRDQIARTRQVKGTILDAVSDGKLEPQRAAAIIKSI